ncbi:MAG: heparinase II/III family protein [Anaerolineales bacterium]|nr:heparinase II/III family protein [Anaerolineales bacterium]
MKPQTAILAVRELGLGPLWLYARYQVGLWSGAHRRRTPCYSWEDQPLDRWLLPGVPNEAVAYAAHRQQNPIPLAPKAPRLGSDLAVAQADAILKGVFPTFGDMRHAAGFPPDWGAFLPPAPAEASLETLGHWSDVRLEGLPADIKLVWELSRFSWVYPLARAYARTEDPRYPQACLTLFDSWMAANPPNRGVHWVSAQEVGFRLLAAGFGLLAFEPWLVDRPERVVQMARLVASHAARIPPTLSYARAQGNNHLLIEAAALLTAGMLFPEMRDGGTWEALGRRWLERGLESQFFEDGGYVQFSSNYHRLALECGLWSACLCQSAGKPLSADSLQALRRGAVCLQVVVDPATGQASNFGPNDGAHLLRLTDCGDHDYRPALQLAWRMLNRRPLYPPGPWDEAARWMGGEAATDSRPSQRRSRASRTGVHAAPSRILPDRVAFPDAGLYRLDGRHSWALLRCAHFRTRPGHSDQLHADLWWRGNPLASDGGTYLYDAPPSWDNGLAGASKHNTVVIDDRDPMLRAGRFLWLRWAQGRMLGHWRSPGGEGQLLSAEHDGYRSIGLTHRRSLLHLAPDSWWVIDDLQGQGEHTVCLTWRLADGPWQLGERGVSLATRVGRVAVQFEGPAASWGVYRSGIRLIGEAGDDATRGWVSPTYSQLRPAVELVVRSQGSLPLRLITRFDLGDSRPARTHIEWRAGADPAPPVRAVRRGQFSWEP